MSATYIEIKKFIDDQIKILNTPLRLDDEMRSIAARHNLSEEKVSSLLFKCNLRLKRHYRSAFNKQVVHQIVQQIVKSENEKLLEVNERLSRIQSLVQPIILPDFQKVGSVKDRVRLANELAHELPEPAYLFAIYDSAAANDSRTPETENLRTESGLVRDNEEMVGDTPGSEIPAASEESKNEASRQNDAGENVEFTETHQEVLNEISNDTMTQDLKEKYTRLRAELLQINGELMYKLQKADYLEKLERKMNFLGPAKAEEYLDSDVEETETISEEKGELLAQISRFNILVEKLEFVMG